MLPYHCDLNLADDGGNEEESSAVSKCPKDGPTIASINVDVDVESDHHDDPAPSYEACLLLENDYRQVYNYRLSSCESERSPPPSYEEVKTQSIFHW